MQALCLTNNTLTFDPTHPEPTVQDGFALIKVTLAGICSTDLELVKGYYPYNGILGHEFVGIVEQCADPSWLGKRVVGSINISPDCGGSCGRRCPEQCPDRTVMGIVAHDGAFADYVTLPTENLHVVPDNVPDHHAVFTEPLAAALRIAEQVEVAQPVAVIGPGRLGILIAQTLRHAGAETTVFGRSAQSLELPQAIGFQTRRTDVSEPTPEFDLVVESTGSPAGLKWAVGVARPNGTIVLKSTYADTPDLANFESVAPLLAKVIVDEICLQGSRCGPFDEALNLLTQGQIEIDALIHATYPIGEGIAAFDHATQRGVRKILLRL